MADDRHKEDFITRIRPHAEWEGIRWGWDLLRAAAIPVLYALFTRLRHTGVDWIGLAILFALCLILGSFTVHSRRRDRKSTDRIIQNPESISASTQPPSRLKIHNADYRAKDGRGDFYNVTECLQKIIRGDSLVLDIKNDNFQVDGHDYVPRDPFFGVIKLLNVTYSFDGVAATAIRPEGTRMVLPEDTFIAAAIAGVPEIPLSLIQIEAFQLAKKLRSLIDANGPYPERTQYGHVGGRFPEVNQIEAYHNARREVNQKLFYRYQRELAPTIKDFLLRVGGSGYPLASAEWDQGIKDKNGFERLAGDLEMVALWFNRKDRSLEQV